MSVRKTPNTQLVNDRTGDIIYTPPTGETLLRDKLTNWERFLYEEDDLDLLVKMAIGHYQFEAIHPFEDGNGRTGRILNILYLIDQDVLDIPILYLSRYIIAHREEYYARLLAVTASQDWQGWLVFMLEGVRETAEWVHEKIEAILELIDATGSFMRDGMPNLYSAELLELLFNQPYCRIANLTDAGIAKRQTASLYLRQMEDKGMLRSLKIGKEKLFVNPRYLSLLIDDRNSFAPYA